MDKKTFKTGEIVISKQGHDQGRIYLVIKEENEFVYLSDGEYRPLEKLKRKRTKHLKYAFNHQTTADAIKANLPTLGQSFRDEDIKRIIKLWRAYAERR